MPAYLSIADRRAGDVTIIDLAGRLVAEEEALAFRRRIDELVALGSTRFLINLQGLSYIDSCGVGSLVAKFVSLTQRNGLFKLASPSARVSRVLRITGLASVFEIFDTVEAALGSFGSPAPLASPGGTIRR